MLVVSFMVDDASVGEALPLALSLAEMIEVFELDATLVRSVLESSVAERVTEASAVVAESVGVAKPVVGTAEDVGSTPLVMDSETSMVVLSVV